MSKTGLFLQTVIACTGVLLTAGCDQDGLHSETIEARSSTATSPLGSQYDDTRRRVDLDGFVETHIGIEADGRIDITHFADLETFGLITLLELKPFEEDDIFQVSLDSEMLSGIEQANGEFQVLPCQLEYLAIDDIYSGNPISLSWIASGEVDYEVYVGIHKADAAKPLATLTQTNEFAEIDLSGHLEQLTDYEVVVEVINHSTHEICLSDGFIAFVPEID